MEVGKLRKENGRLRGKQGIHASKARAKPRNIVDDAGASDSSSSSRSWRPLLGTPAEILQQHPDPLRALSKGKVPAIVIKNQMSKAELAALQERLFKMHAARTLWKSTRPGDPGGYIGVAFTSALKWQLGPKRFSTLAAGAVDSMRQHGIYAPIAALYGGLRALAAGRTVRTARDPLTNRSFTPGTFRMQPNGTVQPVHLDSLHAFDRLACRRSCGCDPASAMPPKDRQQARLSTQYSDMRRFSTQFSALVLLQRSDLASNEVSVYGRYIDDIEKSCDIKLMGQKRDAPGPTNSYTLNFDRSSARRSFHASSEDISSGDIYMFNSGFLHEVHPIIVREHTRMTISTFLGFSDEEVVVWG